MTYVVAATWHAKPGEADAVAAAIGRLVPFVELEPGNLLYQAHRDPEDPNTFFFYEQFVDAAAFQAHVDSAHFQEHAIGDAIPRLDSRDRAFYETWEPS